MFSFGCGIGEPYPLYDISLHVLFFISRPLRPEPYQVHGLRSSPQRTQRKATFSSNREIPIGGKILSATGAKGFQTRQVCRRHESFSPIGISPIGEKFHSLRSPRSGETSFHLVAAMPRCDNIENIIFPPPVISVIICGEDRFHFRLQEEPVEVVPIRGVLIHRSPQL